MKNLFYTLALTLVITVSASAQKVYNLDAPKTEKELIGKATATADKADYQGKTLSVYATEKGKQFVIYINKKGNPAKKYITEYTTTKQFITVKLFLISSGNTAYGEFIEIVSAIDEEQAWNISKAKERAWPRCIEELITTETPSTIYEVGGDM